MFEISLRRGHGLTQGLGLWMRAVGRGQPGLLLLCLVELQVLALEGSDFPREGVDAGGLGLEEGFEGGGVDWAVGRGCGGLLGVLGLEVRNLGLKRSNSCGDGLDRAKDCVEI